MKRLLAICLLLLPRNAVGFAPHPNTLSTSPRWRSTSTRANAGRYSAEEILEMEDDFYKKEARDATLSVKQKPARDPPQLAQCERYRWSQTEERMSVEIPLPKFYRWNEMQFQLTDKTMIMSILTNPGFGEVAGTLMGPIDLNRCTHDVAEIGGEYHLAVELVKQPGVGTKELWYGLFERETHAPTVRFKGSTRRFSWKQTVSGFTLRFPVPSLVTAKGTHIDLTLGRDAGSKAELHLSFDQFPDFGTFIESFRGGIDLKDYTWMLDEEGGEKFLTLDIKKQDGIVSWWSGVFLGDEVWGF